MGVKMLAVGFGPLCPRETGVLQEKSLGPWTAQPQGSAGVAETAGSGDLAEQRCWDAGAGVSLGAATCRCGGPCSPSLAPRHAGAGTQPTMHPQPHSWHGDLPTIYPTHDSVHRPCGDCDPILGRTLAGLGKMGTKGHLALPVPRYPQELLWRDKNLSQGRSGEEAMGCRAGGERRFFIMQPMSGVSGEQHKKHIQFNACC